MVENVIQIKSGITINIDASGKYITHVKKIIFGILQQVVAKNGKYLVSIIDNLAIACGEMIDAEEK